MTDQEALDKIINYYETSFESHLGVIVNLDYTIVAEDKVSATVTNTKGGSYLGRKIYPDVSQAKWRSDIVEKCLLNCYNLRKTSKWLSLRFSRTPDYWLIILTYAPLINPDTNNIIGYKISGEIPDIPLIFYNLEKIIHVSHSDYSLPETSIESLFTLQEQAILFLLFNCQNYQEIANLLTLIYRKKISKSMIAKIVIRKIYAKANVINLPALKKYAHDNGYHKKIPLPLLGEFMFELSEI